MTVTVLGVAVVAGWVSYWHAVAVITRYGAETDPAIHLIPLTIDGMIYASSMTRLWSVRSGIEPGWLSKVALWLGMAATVAANVLQGFAHGWLAAGIAAWPAFALIISYELTMWVIRESRDLADRETRLKADQVPQEPRTGPDHTGPSASDAPVLAAVPDPDGNGEEAEHHDETTGTDPDRSGSVSAATITDRITVSTTVGKSPGKPTGDPPDGETGDGEKVVYTVEQLAQARRIDAEHRAAKGRHISADKLARAMRIGKTKALALSNAVRSELAHASDEPRQHLAQVGAQDGQQVAVPAQGREPAR